MLSPIKSTAAVIQPTLPAKSQVAGLETSAVLSIRLLRGDLRPSRRARSSLNRQAKLRSCPRRGQRVSAPGGDQVRADLDREALGRRGATSERSARRSPHRFGHRRAPVEEVWVEVELSRFGGGRRDQAQVRVLTTRILRTSKALSPGSNLQTIDGSAGDWRALRKIGGPAGSGVLLETGVLVRALRVLRRLLPRSAR